MISHNFLPTRIEHFEIAAAAMDAAGLLLAPGESEDAPPEPSWDDGSDRCGCRVRSTEREVERSRVCW